MPANGSGTTAYQNHHQRDQRDFIQQLMGADTDSHIQTLGGVHGGRGGKIEQNRGWRYQVNKGHKINCPGLMGLEEIREPVGI